MKPSKFRKPAKKIFFSNEIKDDKYIRDCRKYSAIVLNWNESHVSVETVERLLRENIEVVVVDNGSTDGSAEKFKKFGDRIKFIGLDKNYGSSIARNMGIDFCTSEFTFLIDGDILYVPTTIRKYARVLCDYSNAACIGYFDYKRRLSEGWAHGTKNREKADTICGSISQISLWYPMAWTQYGLFRTEVLRKYKFPVLPPYNQYGYGFEDDWLYHEFRKDGWVSINTDTPFYYHDAHFSIRELSKQKLDDMIKSREIVFNAHWGLDSLSSKQLDKFEKKSIPYKKKPYTVDVVMLSYTKDRKFYEMTQNTINTLHDSEVDFEFNIHLVETNKYYKSIGEYVGCKSIIVPHEAFNYNRFLNIGLTYCKSEIIVISNNDIIFTDGWFDEMMRGMAIYSLDSACAWCDRMTEMFQHKYTGDPVEVGYTLGKEVFGYLFVVKKHIFKKLGRFDERFKFWFQDDDYAKQLTKHGIRHGIVKKSVVHHLLSQSHDLLGEKKQEFTDGMRKVFNDKYGQ